MKGDAKTQSKSEVMNPFCCCLNEERYKFTTKNLQFYSIEHKIHLVIKDLSVTICEVRSRSSKSNKQQSYFPLSATRSRKSVCLCPFSRESASCHKPPTSSRKLRLCEQENNIPWARRPERGCEWDANHPPKRTMRFRFLHAIPFYIHRVIICLLRVRRRNAARRWGGRTVATQRLG